MGDRSLADSLDRPGWRLAGSEGQGENASRLCPGKHPGDGLARRSHRLSRHHRMRLRGEFLDPTESENGVPDFQLPNSGALEVVTAFPRLDEGDSPLGVQEGDRKTRKAGPRTQIHHRRDVWKPSIQCHRVEDQPSYNGLGVAVGGQIHPRGPASQELRQSAQGVRESLEPGTREAELLETLPHELAGV